MSDTKRRKYWEVFSAPVPKRVGKYQIEKKLGHGGMGTVWEAYDSQLKRRVAIKLLRNLDSISDEQRSRFEQEAQAIARLQNPYVVRIYDYGVTEDNAPYIVMEMLDGESLSQRLKRVGHMSPQAWAPLLSQVCEALEAAHEADIVHRDIKPANLFLENDGYRVRAKVLDFGIATVASGGSEERFAPAGYFAGTPAYMSPEFTESEAVDLRADLWSLGVVTYEVLTGKSPFEASSVPEVLMKILTKPFAPPSTLVEGLTPELDAFFEQAMAKEKEDRFADAARMESAYRNALPDGLKKTKILVVDDEPDWEVLVAQFFRRQVSRGEYEFYSAENGVKGLELLRDHPDIDIVLTDVRMPQMDGLTFLSKLQETAPILRAIVISAFSDMGNIRQAMNYGAFDFLVKPVDFKDLKITLQKGIKEVRQLRRGLQTMEENESLRMFVNPIARDRIFHAFRVSGGGGAATEVEGTVAVVRVHATEEWSPKQTVKHLSQLYDELVGVLEGQGGVVLRFFGSEAVSLFSDQGHAERAVRSAVEAQSRLGRNLRVGLSTGKIITGTVGASSKNRFEHTAFGAPVQNAYELLQRADEGDILIDDGLADILKDEFRYEPYTKSPPSATISPLHVLTVPGLDALGESKSGAEPLKIGETAAVKSMEVSNSQLDETTVLKPSKKT